MQKVNLMNFCYQWSAIILCWAYILYDTNLANVLRLIGLVLLGVGGIIGLYNIFNKVENES